MIDLCHGSRDDSRNTPKRRDIYSPLLAAELYLRLERELVNGCLLSREIFVMIGTHLDPRKMLGFRQSDNLDNIFQRHAHGIFMGHVILTITEIFRFGAKLKQENELTV